MFNTTRVWTFNSNSSLDSGQFFQNASKHVHKNEESSMVKQSNINIKFSRNCTYYTKGGFIRLFQKTLQMIMRHKQREKEEKKSPFPSLPTSTPKKLHLPSVTGCSLSSPCVPTNLLNIFKTFNLTHPSIDKSKFPTPPK